MELTGGSELTHFMYFDETFLLLGHEARFDKDYQEPDLFLTSWSSVDNV